MAWFPIPEAEAGNREDNPYRRGNSRKTLHFTAAEKACKCLVEQGPERYYGSITCSGRDTRLPEEL